MDDAFPSCDNQGIQFKNMEGDPGASQVVMESEMKTGKLCFPQLLCIHKPNTSFSPGRHVTEALKEFTYINKAFGSISPQESRNAATSSGRQRSSKLVMGKDFCRYR